VAEQVLGAGGLVCLHKQIRLTHDMLNEASSRQLLRTNRFTFVRDDLFNGDTQGEAVTRDQRICVQFGSCTGIDLCALLEGNYHRDRFDFVKGTLPITLLQLQREEWEYVHMFVYVCVCNQGCVPHTKHA